MERRQELNDKLCATLGSENVYFNPPETIKLKYPCIVYSQDGDTERRADNNLYKHIKRYQLTIIDRNPDSTIPDDVLALFSMCSFNRYFVSDSLNHWVLSLFY